MWTLELLARKHELASKLRMNISRCTSNANKRLRGAGWDRRRFLYTSLLAPTAALTVGCGGGGGGNGKDENEGGGTATPPASMTGTIVTKHNNSLEVMNLDHLVLTEYEPRPSTYYPGVGVSRNGYVADVWGDDGVGDDEWHITIMRLDGTTVDVYSVGGVSTRPAGAAVLNADASRLAFSTSEWYSETDDRRIERTYVYDLHTFKELAVIEAFGEPVFVDNGELLLRRDQKVHVFDANLQDGGELPIVVSPRRGAFAGSPDGRYLAYEEGFSQIHVLDRETGATWQATSAIRDSYSPCFSPDGKILAFLHAGSVALTYVHAIPFVSGKTTEIDDTSGLKSAADERMVGFNRIGWAR